MSPLTNGCERVVEAHRDVANEQTTRIRNLYSRGRAFDQTVRFEGRERCEFHFKLPLEVEAMREAAASLIGEHDFVAFQGRGAEVLTTVRRVLAADCTETNVDEDLTLALPPLGRPASPGDEGARECPSRLLRFEITGTGFLRHMVRTIVGTLVDIGRGNMAPDAMPAIIASKDRSRTGQTAPARGLTLWEVTY